MIDLRPCLLGVGCKFYLEVGFLAVPQKQMGFGSTLCLIQTAAGNTGQKQFLLMKNFYLVLAAALMLLGTNARAQFPGQRSKEPYTAKDGHTYKIGDQIQLGYPAQGKNFVTVYAYKYENSMETGGKILGVLAGRNVPDAPKPAPATSDASQFSTKILFFKTFGNTKTTYAIADYKPGYRLAISLDLALETKELVSLNPSYTEQKASATASAIPAVKSFSPAYDVKFVSLIGDTKKQTVTVTLLLSHHLVHQMVCPRVNGRTKAYDDKGNEYTTTSSPNWVASEMSNGCNKIPTGVPVKLTYEFNKVLPDVKTLTYILAPVSYDDYETYYGTGKRGDIEVSNLPLIDWK